MTIPEDIRNRTLLHWLNSVTQNLKTVYNLIYLFPLLSFPHLIPPYLISLLPWCITSQIISDYVAWGGHSLISFGSGVVVECNKGKLLIHTLLWKGSYCHQIYIRIHNGLVIFPLWKNRHFFRNLVYMRDGHSKRNEGYVMASRRWYIYSHNR